MKNTIRRKILGVGFLSALVLSLSSTMAFANNNTDTRFQNTFAMFNSVYTTPFRSKTDKTSVYVKNDGPNRFYVYDILGKTNNGSSTSCIDPRIGKPLINPGQSKKISNYVKEKGHNKAAISLEKGPSLAHNYFITGLWSPDSI